MGLFNRGSRHGGRDGATPGAVARDEEHPEMELAGSWGSNESSHQNDQGREAGRAPEPEHVSEPEVAAEADPVDATDAEEPQEAPEAEEPSEAPAAEEPAGAPAEQREATPTPEPVAEELRSVEESDEGPQIRAATEPAAPAAATDDDEAGRLSVSDALSPRRVPSGFIDPVAAAATKPEGRAEVISFANQKGGVAKTTSTLNLAVAFAESGHRVLCVDLDPQGNLTMSQGIDPDKVDKSMYDVLVHHIPISEVIAKREIDIAVASIDLAGAEIAMSTQIGRERSLEKALSEVSADYDFVCIDTPPSLGLLTINALTASDKVIVPVQCEYLSMRGLMQLQNTLEMIQENLNPRVRIEGILPTMLDSRTVHAKEAVEILEENFGELVFKSRIRKAIKFAEAPVRGASVLKYDPKSNAADYYRELAKEVLTNGAS
jgi:chromosome partitioning protein